MAAEWLELPLEECMSAIIDYRGKTPTKTTSGVPLITAKIVKGGRIEKPEEFISPADYDEWMRRGIPKAGDVVLTTEAPLGEVAQLDGSKVALAQRIITLRGKEGVLDNTFLKFLLQSKGVQEQLHGRSTGTTVHGIRQSELRKVLLLVPPFEEQRAIAHILSTLDDKIELNRRMNETLEAMARALFKSWFVDFDPVRAKAEGRDPGLPKPVADLFPDSFEDSELGEIPKGWEVRRLSALMTFQGGAQPPASVFVSEQRPGYIRLVQIRDFYTSSHITYVPDTPKLRKFTRDDIMIARYGSSGNAEKLSDSLARICRGLEGAYNVALVKVIPHGPWREFLNYFLQTSAFQAVIKGMGARSVQSGFRKEDLDVIPVVSPPLPIVRAFESFAANVWSRSYKANEESSALATLRDTLLRKLLSGEMRVREAASSVEAVA